MVQRDDSDLPPLNGTDAPADVDNPKLTDYSIGQSVIYAAFAWSEASTAAQETFRLAEKHRVGFFDVSATAGGVWLPDGSGGYSCVHGAGATRERWWNFRKRRYSWRAARCDNRRLGFCYTLPP